MRVLVVDDDKLVAVSLKTILEADGEITVVGLGEAGDYAIRLYREQHPDILLMDIRMQGMSGLDAAECILKEDQAAKILFLTTFSDDEYIVKALNMGAKGYLLSRSFRHSRLSTAGRVYSADRLWEKFRCFWQEKAAFPIMITTSVRRSRALLNWWQKA